jgi:hypothetical protein
MEILSGLIRSHTILRESGFHLHIGGRKKVEVYTWINYHVIAGNGAPNFLITLSYAEYYWEDARRLIKD